MVIVPKDPENLKNWMEKYDFQIKTIMAGSVHFLCKTHLSEDKSVERVRKIKFFGNMNYFYLQIPSSSVESATEQYMLEIKEEEPYSQAGSSSESWPEVKEEVIEPVEEIDYDHMPFEIEQNSYETFDESKSYHNSYESDHHQPTTSTSATRAIRRPTTKSLEFTNLPTYLQELSDGEILSFCVKTSSNLSGATSLECGMCEEQYFNSTDTRPIRHHLISRHEATMKKYKNHFPITAAPKIYAPIQQVTIDRADQALTKFFIKSGIPLRAVQDRNLNMLAFNMNSEYSLPTVETMHSFLEKIADAKANAKLNFDDSPVTITFDTTTFNNRHYLAFTVHYYHIRSRMRRCIFLREYDMTGPIVPSVMTAIQKTIEESGSRLKITTVVAGKAEFEDALEDMHSFKQVMICFSQNINKFAETLIEHPVFAGPLQKLRDFITKFPTHRNSWGKFKSYIVKKRTYGEYPEVDNGHWITTLDFITKCLHMHRLFSEFVSTSAQLQYIDVEDNVNIVYLHSLLNLCKSALKEMVDVKATIADVIPAIADISFSLIVTTSKQTVVDAVSTIFNQLLLPFVEQSDIHRFALFLHPLRHGSDLLASADWMKIKTDLSSHLSLREAAEATLAHPSSFDNTITADKEVNAFSQYVCRVTGVETGIMDWWARHAGRFPRLYKYARELFIIPAFSIDAAYYLGEYGILTHSINESDISKRKMLLRAASELVEYRSKGSLMCKPICVKRRKDANSPEDAWYHAIDVRALQIVDVPSDEPPKRMIPQRTPFVYQNPNPLPPHRILQSFPTIRTNREAPHGRSLKDEIAKIAANRQKIQRVYTVASSSPYARPVVVKTESKEGIVEQLTPSAPPPKRYYAVRPAAGNGTSVIRGKDGQVLRVIRNTPS
nr:hypothetical protein F44C4.4 - Caenorhabditis elegans [Caenorhabditis elegans]